MLLERIVLVPSVRRTNFPRDVRGGDESFTFKTSDVDILSRLTCRTAYV